VIYVKQSAQRHQLIAGIRSAPMRVLDDNCWSGGEGWCAQKYLFNDLSKLCQLLFTRGLVITNQLLRKASHSLNKNYSLSPNSNKARISERIHQLHSPDVLFTFRY